jgi:hypothetical protein
MSGPGEDFRHVFEEHLEMFGEDFQISGETKRGVFSDHKGKIKISFLPNEFAVKAGDTAIRWASEKKYKVVSAELDIVAGVPMAFDVFVRPT